MATVSDDFNRANSTNLGSNWAEDSGNWEVLSNTLQNGTSGGSYRKCRWVGSALASNDYAVEAVVQSPNSGIGVGVFGRGAVSATVTYYALILFPTFGVYLVEITAGSESILDSYESSPPGTSTPTTLRLECEGTALRGYVNGTLRVSATDATLGSGAVGAASYGGGSGINPIVDSWTAYDLNEPAAGTSMPAAIAGLLRGRRFQSLMAR